MPRNGAITFGGLDGKLGALRVECATCTRAGHYCQRRGHVRFTPIADICGALADVRLGPKADMCGATSDVRFVPIADIPCAFRWARLRRTQVGFFGRTM